jgi:hypothetical protein
MANTEFIVHEKSGVQHITLSPMHRREVTHSKLVDGILVLGFLGAFVGLILLLAK